MKNETKNAAQPLYHLIAILEDAKKGYLSAADKVKDEVLALLFERFGYQRGRYSNELKQLVNRLGATSSIDQFTLTLLHRTWVDLKSAFRFGQKETMIKACIKGEEIALMNYSKILEQIPENDETKIILQQQANGIKTVLNTMKEYTSVN